MTHQGEDQQMDNGVEPTLERTVVSIQPTDRPTELEFVM